MPKLTYFVDGGWNGICDQCGRGFKFSKLGKRWDGAYACPDCWEPRQPQDFVRGVKDDSSISVGRPQTINYLSICDLLGSQAVAGLAVAGCAVASRDEGLR